MDMLKKALRLSVPAFLLCTGNSYAVPLDISPNRHTTFTTELESTDSYQIARAVFLPDTSDDLGMSGRHFKDGYYTPDITCADYNLTSCPPGGWKCSECLRNGVETVYKTNGCKDGYELSEDGTKCIQTETCTLPDCVDKVTSIPKNSSYTTESCKDCYGTKTINTGWTCNSGYEQSGNTCVEKAKCTLPDCVDKVTSIPKNSSYTTEMCTDCSGTKEINTGWECNTNYHKKGNECEKDCIATNCSGFPHTRCPDGAKCSECTKTASNCSTDGVRYKVDSCTDGYELSGNTCIEKAKCTLPDCADKVTSKPDNSSYTTASCTDCSGTKTIKTGWTCNNGYEKSGNTCVDKTINEDNNGAQTDCTTTLNFTDANKTTEIAKLVPYNGKDYAVWTRAIGLNWKRVKEHCSAGGYGYPDREFAKYLIANEKILGLATLIGSGSGNSYTRTSESCVIPQENKYNGYYYGCNSATNCECKQDDTTSTVSPVCIKLFCDEDCKDNEFNTNTDWCNYPVTFDCAVLGYKRASGSCKDLHQLACPFDPSKVACFDFN